MAEAGRGRGGGGQSRAVEAGENMSLEDFGVEGGNGGGEMMRRRRRRRRHDFDFRPKTEPFGIKRGEGLRDFIGQKYIIIKKWSTLGVELQFEKTFG